MEQHFNNLTPAEQERLVIVQEECAEVIQIICKILRHGYESYHPDDDTKSNRELLEKELGDLTENIDRLCVRDVNRTQIEHFAKQKRKNIVQYLHHQKS
jgi:hypothetical protein